MLKNKMSWLTSQSYLKIKRHSDTSIDDEAPFIPSLSEKSINDARSDWARVMSDRRLPWLFFLILASLNALFFFISPSRQVPWNTTDFQSSRNVISNKLVQFKSSLDLLDKSTALRVYDPEEPVYVGNGTEVDDNWRTLIMPSYNDIIISPEEAGSVEGDLYLDVKDDTYTITVSVFHSLHCLNQIRKRIYSHLHPEMLTEFAQTHVDHCIEALRETIMCFGDMTPIPYEWSEAGQRSIPNSANVHYCRDFDQLRDWMVVERHIDKQA